MPNLNKALLMGHLGKDPELQTTKNGKQVCKFSLATNERYNDEDHTTWHNIVAWGKQAEVISQYLHKGSALFVEGRIDNRQYEDNGVTKYFSEVVVMNFQFIGGRDSDESPKPKASAESSDDEDYPF